MVIAAKGQSSLEETLSECRGMSADTEDPLYGCQWHLKNTGQFSISGNRITAGEDINIEGVWNEYVYGTGINVAVVSDGIDLSHEDLSANVRSELNYSFSEKDNSDSSSFTGTRAAGVIAAAGYNGLGVRGTAPGASIYSYRLSGDLREADAVVRNKEITAVSVNGLGSEDGAFFQEALSSWEEGVELGISKGFYGKGVFYVRGAGDGHENNDQANFSEYSNYYGVTAVCSTDGYGKKSIFSEEGVNLWVCAPGSDIVTTDNNNDYVVTSGTFLSASQVGGVAALLREINGNLSWRDIKLILAGSARQNDFSDISWETGAVKYGSDTERYNYNPKYGFGVVDAEAAAELAGSWKGVGEMRTVTAFSDNEITIPDGEGEADGILTSTLMIPDLEEIFTEFVEVELVFSHDRLQDLNIQITSPSGTVSELVREVVRGSSNEEENCVSYLRRTHRFGSAKHLGEDPSGEWILNISDTASGDAENTVTLHSWSIKVYGHFYQGTGNEINPKHHRLNFGGQTIQDQEYQVEVQIAPLVLPRATGDTGIQYNLTDDPNTDGFATNVPIDGLSFNRGTRTLSGTPTNTGSFDLIYSAVGRTDGTAAQLEFNVTVVNVPTFGGQTIPDHTYARLQTIRNPLTFPKATGGNAPLTYSITPKVQTGLAFSSSTRRITGSPGTVRSRTEHTYTVTDNEGDTAEITFGITVEGNDRRPRFRAGENISDKFYFTGVPITPVTLPRATNGNSPIKYSLNPSLPTGLSFNANTREISGTPTAASSNTEYTYRASDLDGDRRDLKFSITVRDATDVPTFGSETIDDQEHTAGSQITPVTLPEATSGDAPLIYRLTPALPDGLIYNNITGVISGTPTAAMSETMYTYTVTDNDGDTDELTFNIEVAASFSNVTIEDKVYIAGTAVTEMLPEATGHNGTVTYSLTPSLPTGLDFNTATREISGTPSAASSQTAYTYTVTTGAGGPARTLTFRITVEEDSMPDFSGTAIPDRVYTGRAITLPEATGGNPPVTYSITPDLPAGLRFNEVTREISGTPRSASTRTYTYTVTDSNGDTDDATFMLSVEVTSTPGPTPPRGPRTSGTDSGGGGGGCAVSDQISVVYDILGAVACLILIPVSVVIRRKRRAQIKT